VEKGELRENVDDHERMQNEQANALEKRSDVLQRETRLGDPSKLL